MDTEVPRVSHGSSKWDIQIRKGEPIVSIDLTVNTGEKLTCLPFIMLTPDHVDPTLIQEAAFRVAIYLHEHIGLPITMVDQDTGQISYVMPESSAKE